MFAVFSEKNFKGDVLGTGVGSGVTVGVGVGVGISNVGLILFAAGSVFLGGGEAGRARFFWLLKSAIWLNKPSSKSSSKSQESPEAKGSQREKKKFKVTNAYLVQVYR